MPTSDFTSIFAPDAAVQAQRLQQQQQLAQMLMMRGMQNQGGTQMAGNVAIRNSPLSGLVNVGSALLGKKLQDKAWQQETDLNRQNSQRMLGMFGIDNLNNPSSPAAPAIPAAGGTVDAPPMPPAADPGASASKMQVLASALRGAPAAPMIDPSAAGGSPQMPGNIPQPAPDAAPALGPIAAPAVQGGSAQSPMVIPGMTPQKALMAYSLNPNAYTAALVSQYAPTDLQKNDHAYGLSPDEGAANYRAQRAKDVYIPPINARPGSTIIDPRTNRPMMTLPNNEGYQVQYDASGNPTATQVPNALNLIRQAEAARRGGQNSAEPISGVDANGNPIFTNKTAAAGGGMGGGAPAPSNVPGGAPAAPGTPAVRPGLPAGTAEILKGYTDRHNAAIGAAQTAPQDINALQNIDKLATETKTGPGQAAKYQWEGLVNLIPGINVNNTNANNVAVIKKYIANMAAQGLTTGTGSDKQLENMIQSLPNDSLPSGAIHEIVPYLVAQKAAINARANAGQQVLQESGNNPNALGQFEQQWRQNFDPRIFQVHQMDPQAAAQYGAQLKKSDPAAFNALIQKMQFFKQKGWLQ